MENNRENIIRQNTFRVFLKTGRKPVRQNSYTIQLKKKPVFIKV